MTQIPMTQVHTTQVHSAQVLQQAPVRVRPELDEVTLRYIQDLLSWVEENQRRVDKGSGARTFPAWSPSWAANEASISVWRSSAPR